MVVFLQYFRAKHFGEAHLLSKRSLVAITQGSLGVLAYDWFQQPVIEVTLDKYGQSTIKFGVRQVQPAGTNAAAWFQA